MKNSKNQIFIITATGILVFVAVFAGILLTRNAGKSTKTINTESAISVIERYVKKNRSKAGRGDKVTGGADGQPCRRAAGY